MKSVLLDRSTLSLTDKDIEGLWSGLEHLNTYDTTSAKQTVERCKDAQVVFTNKVVFDKSILDQLPKLKYIGILATGTNNVDLEYAKTKGITVKNVAGYSTHSVAQHTLGLMINLSMSLHNYEKEKSLWPISETFCRTIHPSFQLKDKVLGIIGYGTIGKEVARLAEAFEMDILVCESFHPEAKNMDRVSLDEVLAQSDFISLHCPLTEATENLVDKSFLKKMKSTAFLINTARGPIVNEMDLANALKEETIAGAGLDVLSQEPPSADNPLIQLEHPKLLITPHVAWAARESQLELIEKARQELEKFLSSD